MGRDNKAHYGLSLRVSPLGQVWQKEKRKKERLNDGNNNGQLRIAIATSGGAHKAAWANVNTKQLSRDVFISDHWDVLDT